MSARFVSTTRLSNVVQMIALARQSGILRVTRGQSPTTRELGQIRFADGQPVAALLGQLTGQAALDVLMNWGECLYAFDEGAAADSSEGADTSWPGGAFGGLGPSTASPLPGASAGSWPSYGYGSSPSAASMPSSAPLSPPVGSSATSPSLLPPLGSFPPAGAPPTYSEPRAAPPPRRAGGGMGPGAAATGRERTNPAAVTVSELPALTPELLQTVPVRTPISTQVDQLPLDRRERMVLLLIDGRRTVADLTQLIRRSQQEVYAVLTHLRLLGLIRLGK